MSDAGICRILCCLAARCRIPRVPEKNLRSKSVFRDVSGVIRTSFAFDSHLKRPEPDDDEVGRHTGAHALGFLRQRTNGDDDEA